jgi:kynureninase
LFKKGFRLGSPEFVEKRGSHVSLKHAEAYRICRALIDPRVGDHVVIPDFREPNNIRLGITPLYTSYEEIFRAVDQLQLIIDQKIYDRYPLTRDTVT